MPKIIQNFFLKSNAIKCKNSCVRISSPSKDEVQICAPTDDMIEKSIEDTFNRYDDLLKNLAK